MTRRVIRILLILGLAAAAGLAGWQIWSLDQARRQQRLDADALQAVTIRVTQALLDVRASQRAYLSPDQGLDFWRPRVDAEFLALRDTLQTLRNTASDASTPLDDAALDALGEAIRIERRMADHVQAGRVQHAADLMYADNIRSGLALERAVEAALAAHRADLESHQAQVRQQELIVLGLIALVGTMFGMVLAYGGGGQAAPSAEESEDNTLGLRDLPLRVEEHRVAPATVPAAAATVATAATAAAAAVAAPPRAPAEDVKAGAALRAAAELCVSMARVGDADGLQPLLARLADQLDAVGLIVWLENSDGRSLTPAMTQGYPAETLTLMRAIDRDADNATARAFRLGEPQIVAGTVATATAASGSGAGSSANPGAASATGSAPSASPGAIVVPMLAASGCVGVITAELRHGRERDPATLALARIVAAQLATLTGPAPVAGPAAATTTTGAS